MRSFLLTIVLAFSVSFALAGDNCGGCSKSCHTKCGGPDWAVTYNSAFYMPDCAPEALEDFQEALIPVIEARRSMEEAYIRENAGCLYRASKEVAKMHEECCSKMDRKHYKRAAKDLVRDCKQLKELAYGGSSSALYEHVKNIEQDFIRLSNLCE